MSTFLLKPGLTQPEAEPKDPGPVLKRTYGYTWSLTPSVHKVMTKSRPPNLRTVPVSPEARITPSSSRLVVLSWKPLPLGL